MNPFKNVLLYFNPECGAIRDKVVELVRARNASLTIIDVFEHFDQYLEILPPSTSIGELESLIISERREEISALFRSYPDIYDAMNIVIRFGNPPVEIIRQVLAERHDLVIKAASGSRRFRDRLFGDTAAKLLRKCPCPVLIVKPSERVAFNNILAPVDPGALAASETEATSLSGSILQMAAEMARMNTAKLEILHCWQIPGETLLSSGRTRIAPEKLQSMRTMAEKLHRQKINRLVSETELGGIDYNVSVLKGDPGDVIPDFAEKRGIDLIVMGTVAKSALSGILIGSTAEMVTNRVNCSVLTVKPADFVSPIQPGELESGP